MFSGYNGGDALEREGVMTEQETAPQRSDAQQNRALLLDAALQAFTESGSASLNSIAKRAGVGIGTLYRHFPTREALVLEVYRNEVQELAAAAPALLDREPPLAALRGWMDRLAQYGMAKTAFAELLSTAAPHDALAAETHGPVVGALTMLLEANERAGTIRPGVDPDDVLLLLGFLWRIHPHDDAQERTRALLDLVVDGLRAGARKR
jgi:AcrR family transcriptional regulator